MVLYSAGVSMEPGLRERKRIATRRAIQHAVLTLTAERGIDKVTVEDVSRLADISPRTFFNYFASKDAALIGDVPHLPDDDAVEAFVHAGPDGAILVEIGELFATAASSVEEDREIHLLRHSVLRDNPHLFGLRMASVRDFEAALHEIVERRLTADAPDVAADRKALFERASLIAMLAFATMRHAWRCWADTDELDPLSERVRASFAQLHEILHETG
ncbi:TetR/AcrR family transcriptional regulator [Luethyella okanaganae]|uniref:TetR/AcrR family transcriptional regulator n=1 Tax=Luethyella okanaganae TaxID=69372 RepID=A0ABW1V9Q3_9MICO